jgi:oligopeptidase B
MPAKAHHNLMRALTANAMRFNMRLPMLLLVLILASNGPTFGFATSPLYTAGGYGKEIRRTLLFHPWPPRPTERLIAKARFPQSEAPRAKPPVAKKIPHEVSLHGDRRIDDYFWLREKTNPDVVHYLEAENTYADATMKPTESMRESLYREMLRRIKQTDLSVPHRDRGYFYYSRTEEGKQYPIFCRKKGHLDAAEQITLDPNELGKGHQFFSVSVHSVSDNGRFLAYTFDTTGFRQYTLHIKDLETDSAFDDRAERVGSVAWAADNQTLFYSVEDDAKRQYRLYRHRLGTRSEDDELVYEEADERFDIAVERSRGQEMIILSCGSQTSSEVRFILANRPASPPQIVIPRQPDTEYDVEHHGSKFYIRINDTGRNFRLVSIPIHNGSKETWTEIVPHRDDVMLERADFFSTHYVLQEREAGLPQLRVVDLRSGASRMIEFPEPTYAVFPAANPEFDATAYRYNYQSHVTPNSVFDYDLDTGQSKLLKQTEVLGGYDRTQYHSERVFAQTGDGQRIPISIVSRNDVPRDGTAPMLLEGYGSYGLAFPVTFSSNDISLLDRGVVLATAHVRGGGEMGKTWHDQGRMMHKMNTFTDFIAAAEYLIEQRYTRPDRLVVQGASAGGLLMGATANMRPDLFKAVVTKVPFVDVINTMCDASLPLTATEFEEWGNPAIPAEYEYMKLYCPYTNLAAKRYPAMLVKTSFQDSQVMYWEPAKYVAKLRCLNASDAPVLLKTNMSGGHGGSSGRYDRLREDAFDYAFILDQLGIRH